MQVVRYRITNLAPTVFTSKTGDPNMVSTLDYVPGKLLWGLFANEYIARHNLFGKAEEDPTFMNWFTNGTIKFLNAYITDVLDYRTRTFYPLPLSIQKEKYRNYAYDIFQLGPDSNIDLKIIDSYGVIEDEVIYTKRVRKSLHFHHKRDRKRGVSEEGIIFNYEAIMPNQIFEGQIIGSREDLLRFREIFHKNIYFIGRSRHNQYGMIKFEILDSEPSNIDSELDNLTDQEGEITLYLISDTIVLNDKNFPSVNIEDFEKATGLKVKNCIIRSSEEESYRSVWKTKTPSYVCFKAGSSFLINLDESDLSHIKNLMINGIGEMTHLGFGRFRLVKCSSMGYKIFSEEESEKAKKPTYFTNLSKQMIINIVIDNLKNIIETRAMRDAHSFNKLPSKSLLSKLEKAVKDGNLGEVLKNMEKKQAKNQLDECINKNTTLYNFLSNYLSKGGNKIIDYAKEDPRLKSLIEETQIEKEISEKDSYFRSLYLLTLISTLRKRAKSKERR